MWKRTGVYMKEKISPTRRLLDKHDEHKLAKEKEHSGNEEWMKSTVERSGRSTTEDKTSEWCKRRGDRYNMDI